MVDFYFLSDKEVSQFCESIFKELQNIEFRWKQDDKFGNCVQLDWNEEDITDEKLHVLALAYVDVFMKFRRDTYVKELLQEVYYFKNEVEVNRIVDVSHSIMFSEDEESRLLNKEFNVSAALYDLFLSMIKSEAEIHFDSIVQFRFYEVKELFIEHIGLAIDEYKREEEHQAFLEMLREYVETLEAKSEEIHVVQGSTFQFFNATGKELVRFELRAAMYESPLYLVGLDVEEFTLSPLIALSPKHIYIYGDDPPDPKTITVMNVFQERVTYYPLYTFPFTLKKRNSD